MAKENALERLVEAATRHRLFEPGSTGLVLISGGADSACLAAAMTRAAGAENVSALHLNYRLRDDAGTDEEACRELCGLLRIDLHIERPDPGSATGNLQAACREARYAAADRLRARLGAEWVAVGHSRTDLAETMIYRLATAPGTRALRGMPRVSGTIIRPLLDLGRAELRGLARESGLPFVDDPTNRSPRFARNRIRHEVLPVLEGIGSAFERNVAETREELAEESDLLERIAFEELGRGGAGAGATAVPAAALEDMHPALGRLAIRQLAERAAGRLVAVSRERAAAIRRLAGEPEGGVVELGGGIRCVVEAGWVRLEPEAALEAAPGPVALKVPGSCRMGEWEVRASIGEVTAPARRPDVATLDADAIDAPLTVRPWRSGDRIKPLGMRGHKRLQDIFTDARVSRSSRRTMPVVACGERVMWVPGLVISDDFRLTEGSQRAARLTAVHCGP